MGASEPGAVPSDDPRLLGVRQALWIMDSLRGDDGCPWDRRQTHASLRPFLLEETYELLEAIDAEAVAEVREELGDVLFQVLFHARIGQERGEFDLGDVAAGIARKLFERHPHVFGSEEERQADPEAIAAAWEEHKRRSGRTSVLDGIPAPLPALLRAQKVQEKAARVGFDWPDASGPHAKVREELDELAAETGPDGSPERAADELGDLLFSVVNLARHLKIDAELALREATAKFERRFRRVEKDGGDLRQLELDALEALWQAAKKAEGER